MLLVSTGLLKGICLISVTGFGFSDSFLDCFKWPHRVQIESERESEKVEEERGAGKDTNQVALGRKRKTDNHA